MEFFSHPLTKIWRQVKRDDGIFFHSLTKIWRQVERMEFFFPSSHKDLAPGGDTQGPECHKPQIGVPKMDTWQGCDNLSLARPDP
jgi:hypothetical protein